MPADPSRIAQYTVDGVVLSRVDTVLRAAFPDAVDMGDQEIEMFFDSPADADVVLTERWNWQKTAGRLHEAVEVEASLGLGTIVPLTPAVPQMTVVDEKRGIGAVAKVRALASDYSTERHSVELLG